MSTADANEAFTQALRDDDADVLYDRAPCGYLSTDPNGLIVKVNQTFLTMTGYHREQLVGRRRFADLLTVGGRIYHDTHYAPMLQMQDSAREIALDLLRPDGTRLPVLVTSLLERDPHGEPQVIRTAIFDATERRRYEQELLLATRRAEQSEAHARDLAATLQASLIPPVAPHIPGLNIATAYHPAGTGQQIGGDFYDVYPTGPDEWIIALGDVSGKGVDAAIVTALIRHTLRAVTIENRDPAHALTVLNDVLYHDDTDRFCTLALVRYATTTRAGMRASASADTHHHSYAEPASHRPPSDAPAPSSAPSPPGPSTPPTPNFSPATHCCSTPTASPRPATTTPSTTKPDSTPSSNNTRSTTPTPRRPIPWSTRSCATSSPSNTTTPATTSPCSASPSPPDRPSPSEA